MSTFPLEARAPPANFNQHFRLEQSPAAGGALAIAAPGGDGCRKHSAKISLRACRGKPLAPYAACGRRVSYCDHGR